MECLNEIIGLSQSTCECLEEGRPTNYDVSKSGVYLDRLEGFNIDVATGADGCNDGDIWQRMATAVEDAKLAYRADLMGCVARTHRPRLNNFHGQLGQSSFKKTVNVNAGYAGMKLQPVYMRGGYIAINKIGVIINQTAPVTVQIYSDENLSTLVYTSPPINATQDMITWATLTDEDDNDSPLELPMWSESGDYIKYYVLMVLNGSFKPKDNKSSCGCGGGTTTTAYDKWLTFHGVYGNDPVDNLQGFSSSGNLILNGIALNVDLICKVSEIVCSDFHPLDFTNDGNAINMAYAIRFKAGALLYEALLASGNINRYTMLNRDYCAAKIKEWTEIYQAYINDSCTNSDRLYDNDCLICRDGKGTIIKRHIKV